jgi:hypothetical protein
MRGISVQVHSSPAVTDPPPHFPDDLVDVVKWQDSRFFGQLATPFKQDLVLERPCRLIVVIVNNPLDRRFTLMEIQHE